MIDKKNQLIEDNILSDWTFNDVVSALQFFSDPIDLPITGFSIDSRTTKPGDCFIAIRGKNNNGHDYIEEAFNNGAYLCVVDDPELPSLKNRSYLVVEDTKKALMDISQYIRCNTLATIVGVSGSVGKTTVRSWIANILEDFGATVQSQKNYNGEIGLPLSMTSLKKDSKFGVLEIGIDKKNSMQNLSMLCRPHVAVITPITYSHFEFFDSIEEIADEKAMLFSGLCSGGVAIIDKVSSDRFPVLQHLAKEYGASDVITVGFDKTSTAYIESHSYNKKDNTTVVNAVISGVLITYSIPVFGDHMIINSLMSLVSAVCSLFDDSLEVIMKEKWSSISDLIVNKMSKLEQLTGRGELLDISLSDGRNFVLIDDSYNANPLSLMSGLESFSNYKGYNNKVAIIGSMLELGSVSKDSHKEVFNFINRSDINKVYAIGELTKEGFDSLDNNKKIKWSENISNIVDEIIDSINDNDIIFVKGSNSIGLSKLVESMKKLNCHNRDVCKNKKIA